MIARFAGALARAGFVVIVVALPSLMLPGVGSDTTQIVALLALFAGLFTFFEYSAVYPSLVEFRDAPPFNRIRFASLFMTVGILSLIARGAVHPSTLSDFAGSVGYLVGRAMDFPFSPVRLVSISLYQPDPAVNEAVRTAAGVAYITSLMSLALFMAVMRIFNWPAAKGGFNVWVNLPTFDPTQGGDVVERLKRDARVNVALGFLLPFFVPVALKMATDLFDPVTLSSPQNVIWMMTIWAFLPASLFMRGIAMGRVADMIDNKRREVYAAAKAQGLMAA